MIDLQFKRVVSSRNRQFTLDIQLQSQARRIVLFGPSGSGKTLTLRAIAGLLHPGQGVIRVFGQTYFDSDARIDLAPQQRKLGYVHQDYSLFPHLTVAQNMVFGLRRGLLSSSRQALPEHVAHWATALDLQQLLNNYPAQLSGGQQQRVALVRALAVRPRLLLLDEPLAALDITLRHQARAVLLDVQARSRVPSIVITHDPDDARVLADQVFLIRDGAIVGQCAPDDLPAN